MEFNTSDDIQMEMISYLKPIEIFQSITLINKQFNKNVQMMHQSYQYGDVFCDKHYVFESFNEFKKCCDDDITLDFQGINGRWSNTYGRIDVNKIVQHSKFAPFRTMSRRPGNMDKFINILKRAT